MSVVIKTRMVTEDHFVIQIGDVTIGEHVDRHIEELAAQSNDVCKAHSIEVLIDQATVDAYLSLREARGRSKKGNKAF